MPGEVINLCSSPEPPPAKEVPNRETATKLPGKAPADEVALPVSSTWNWDGLSSDSIGATPVPKARTVNCAPPLTNGSSKANGTMKSAIPVKEVTDEFHILDDSNPFASPPAKRRRVSSSPQALPSNKPVPKVTGYKRSVSNIESSTRTAGSRTATVPTYKRPNTTNTVLESDPIQHTSSPNYVAEAVRKRKQKKRQTWESDEDEELPGLSDIAEHHGKLKVGRGEENKAYTVEYEDKEDYGSALTRRSKHDSFRPMPLGDLSSDLDLPPIKSRPAKDPPKTSKGSSQSALEKYNAEKAKEKAARDKAQKAKEKADAKVAEKKRKRLEKEEKAVKKAEDAAIAKANIRRTDKKVSILEMIVDLPSSLDPKLKAQLRTFLDGKTAEHSEWESQLPVVKWRRKVDRMYDKEKDRWDAAPKTIQAEDTVVCFLLAKEFVELATGDEGQNLDAHVLRMKAKFDSCKIVYLIEGLMPWMRKNRNTKDRQFKEAVRSHLPAEEPTASQRRKKKEAEYVNEDIIEDALLQLHVVHGILIHHTHFMIETAELILNFTEQISLRPEKLRTQTLDTTFCMETGQVKTGDDPADTYVKMLQEIKRVTPAVAHGIAAEYPTVQKLVRGFEANGEQAVEDCRKSSNGNGAFADRRVGPAISKRLFQIFMSRDPESTDV